MLDALLAESLAALSLLRQLGLLQPEQRLQKISMASSRALEPYSITRIEPQYVPNSLSIVNLALFQFWRHSVCKAFIVGPELCMQECCTEEDAHTYRPNSVHKGPLLYQYMG